MGKALIEEFERVVVDLPTLHGKFKLMAINDDEKNSTVVLYMGDLKSANTPLIRIHSECLTGDVFGSCRCDCGPQLHYAMKRIAQEGAGAIIYMRQEGRGIGLFNKIKAYQFQEQGYDTVEANLVLGFPDDEREYSKAAEILTLFGVKQVRIITNNPKKIRALVENGIKVLERIPVEISPNENNLRYMLTKKEKMGHLLFLSEMEK